MKLPCPSRDQLRRLVEEVLDEAEDARVARHIEDPVARLRFLRVAAPCGKFGSRFSGWRGILMLLLPLALVVFLILTFAMVYSRIAKSPLATQPGAVSQSEKTLSHEVPGNPVK